jgi:uncharacterized membrane protein
MDWFPITSSIGVLAVLGGICAFFFWFERATGWRFFQIVPTLLFIYLVPVALTNSGLLPKKSPVYDTIQSLLLPMLLTLLLLNLNVARAFRVLGRSMGVMLMGSLGVMVGAIVGLTVVKPWLGPESWKSFGALSGSWIGGSANMAAVSEMLRTSGEAYGLAMLADTTIPYVLWIPLLLGSKKFADRFASFTRFERSDEDDGADADAPHVAVATAPTTRDYVYLICVALLVTWFADSAAIWIEHSLASWGAPAVPNAAVTTESAPYLNAATWKILLITIFGIALSFTPVSRIPGSQELGMALLYIFVARMGATAVLDKIYEQAIPFLIGALIMISIHGAFCVLGARLFRTDLHTAAIASAANIGGVASATIVASYHRRSLVPAGILMALIGYALGNFCGYVTGLICHAMM